MTHPSKHPTKTRSRTTLGIGHALVLLLAPSISLQAQDKPAADTTATALANQPAKKANAASDATSPVSVATETVTGQSDIQIPVSPEIESLKLTLVPGGTGLISGAEVEQGRVQTDADILNYQPGVYAQPVDGSDRLKISIRGSAINKGGGTGSFYSGVYLLFDGLPVSGPGGTSYELFEPLGLAYTEVLKGANGLDIGSVSLGGAINYVSKTGYDALPFEARFETGSFGYVKGQLSSGQVLGKWDYYLSLTQSKLQGFRGFSRANSGGAEFNLGYKFSDRFSTRLYIRHRYTFNDTGAGSLTRAQIEADPTQISPAATTASYLAKSWSRRIEPGSTWIADKSILKIDPEQTFEAGVVFQNYPIDQEAFSYPPYSYAPIQTIYPNGYATKGVWYFGDISASLKYTNVKPLFGLNSEFAAGLTTSRHLYAGVERYDIDPVTRYRTLVSEYENNGSSDNTLFFRENLEVLKNFWLIGGVSEAWIRRVSVMVKPITVETGAPYSSNNYYALPRFGFRYDLNPNLSLYGNISRSVEPLNAWAFNSGPPYFTPTISGTLLGTTTALGARPLKDQTAVSEELGIKGKAGIFSGSLGVFREYVDNELLTVIIQHANTAPYYYATDLTSQSNATPTTKQGIEAALDTQLWRNESQKLSLRQSYTFTDFHYDNDPVFGRAKQPGLPPKFYQAELHYEHPSGFYAGASLQYASRYAVDFANTFNTDPYTIYGLNLGFQPPKKHWQVFVDLRNLTNKHYAAAVSPSYNVNGLDTAISSPGAPFSWTSGFEIGF